MLNMSKQIETMLTKIVQGISITDKHVPTVLMYTSYRSTN